MPVKPRPYENVREQGDLSSSMDGRAGRQAIDGLMRPDHAACGWLVVESLGRTGGRPAPDSVKGCDYLSGGPLGIFFSAFDSIGTRFPNRELDVPANYYFF